MKFTHHFNFTPTDGSENNDPSLTVQGQTVSIAKMLQRIQGGIIPTGNMLEYPEDENELQMRPNDLTAIDDYKHELSRLRKKQIEQQKLDAENNQKNEADEASKAQ